MNAQYLSAIKLLPNSIADLLFTVEENITEKATEIRLRSGKPISLTTKGGTIYPYFNGYSLLPDNYSVIASPYMIKEAFQQLCNNSVYSHEEELSQGFLILKDGHRAGICGRVIKKNDEKPWITDISSINIRIAHEVKGVAEQVFGQTSDFCGLLICGPPNSGKTTMLRDYIRIASQRGERVALVDCRGEIAAVKNSLCGLDVGINTDVITGGDKANGIELALRVLSADIIAFDEIGTIDELTKIRDCLNSGVKVVTTFHCQDCEQLIRRNKYLPILDTGAFSHFIFLGKDYRPQVFKECELENETSGNSGSNNILYSLRNDNFVQVV